MSESLGVTPTADTQQLTGEGHNFIVFACGMLAHTVIARVATFLGSQPHVVYTGKSQQDAEDKQFYVRWNKPKHK